MTSKKFLVILILISSFVLILAAESLSIDWTNLGPPGQGQFDVIDIVFDPTDANIAYALVLDKSSYFLTTQQYALFKTIDKGENWFELDGARNFWHSYNIYGEGYDMALMYKLYIQPRSPNTLYATGRSDSSCPLKGAIFRSEDGGENWECIHQVPDGTWRLAVYPEDPDVLYKRDRLNFYSPNIEITTDEGDNWITTSNGLPSAGGCMSLAVNPGDHKNAVSHFAYFTNFLYGWTGIYTTTNEGFSWQLTEQVTIGGVVQDGVRYICDISFNPQSTNEVIGLMRAGHDYRNVGGSFELVGPYKPCIYWSTDFGQSWITWEMESFPVSWTDWFERESVSSYDPNNFNTIYFGQRGLYKSTDKGVNWIRLDGSGGLPEDIDVVSITVSSKEPNTIFVGTWGPSGIYRSTDSGINWQKVDEGLGYLPVRYVGIDPAMPRNIYAYSSRGLGTYKTTNYGTSWATAFPYYQTWFFETLALDPENSGTMYIYWPPSDTYGISKSTDYGENWDYVKQLAEEERCNFIRICPSSPEVVYAQISGGGNPRLIKSTNAGSAWNDISGSEGTEEVADDLIIDPASPDVLYKWRQRGLWGIKKSTTGGTTWTSLEYSGNEITTVSAMAIDPEDPNRLYAAWKVGPDWQYAIFKSTNGGADWSKIGIADYYMAITDIAVNANPNSSSSVIYALENTTWNNSDLYRIAGVIPEKIGSLLPVDNRSFRLVSMKLALDPVTEPVIYLASSRGIYKSIDIAVSPPPEIISIDPPSGLRVAPNPIVINGNYFFDLENLYLKRKDSEFNVPIPIISYDYTSIISIVPPGLDPGTYEVIVDSVGLPTVTGGTYEVGAPPPGGPEITHVTFDDWSYYPADFHYEPISPSPYITAHISDESGIATVESFGLTVINADSPTDYGTREISSSAFHEDNPAKTQGELEFDVLPPLLPGKYYMYIYAKDLLGNVGYWTGGVEVEVGPVRLIGEVLSYPSIFKPLKEGGNIRIAYNLSRNAETTVYMYDVSGQLVLTKKFSAGEMGGKAGYNQFEWNGISDFGGYVGNGIYVIKVTSGNKAIGTGKIVVFD